MAENPKTTEQIAEEAVKMTLGLLALMRPENKQETDSFVVIATRVVSIHIDLHVQSQVESAMRVAQEVMKDK